MTKITDDTNKNTYIFNKHNIIAVYLENNRFYNIPRSGYKDYQYKVNVVTIENRVYEFYYKDIYRAENNLNKFL